MHIAILLPGLLLLAALIACEKLAAPRLRLAAKSLLSALFIVAALSAGKGFTLAFTLLFIGLCLCFLGDVFLALSHKKAFLIGLVCFLLGHVLYTACFFSLSGLPAAFWAGLALCLSAGVFVLRRLKPYLGSMKIPVFFYVAVISVMMAAACGLAVNAPLPAGARAMAFAGALLFYSSDLFVARHRFVRQSFINRLVGLPLYYAGQFLLAFFGGLIS